jgi:hypothetical protein
MNPNPRLQEMAIIDFSKEIGVGRAYHKPDRRPVERIDAWPKS